MTAPTEGKALAAELRRRFHVGPKTRQRRKDSYGDMQDLRRDMLEAVHHAVVYEGYYSPEVTARLRPGWGPFLAWQKHVDGYRIDGTLRMRLIALSPWQFAGLLGDMADAGVTCTGDGERFFAAMARDSES
jgi:hypothetical protein